jgi:hypothetical protein
MINLELCMLTCSHAHHGAFHGHLRGMKAHLKTLRLTLEPWRLTGRGALYAHPQLYFAINITANSCHSSCDAIPLKKLILWKITRNFAKLKPFSYKNFDFREIPKATFVNTLIVSAQCLRLFSDRSNVWRFCHFKLTQRMLVSFCADSVRAEWVSCCVDSV